MSFYYKRFELTLRFNIFMSSSILAGAFGGVSLFIYVLNITKGSEG
jgi:hypothetical protein